MTGSSPFADAEAWDVSGTILTARNDPYLCRVQSINAEGDSSGGHPQLEVQVGNDEGSIKDWIVVIPTSIGKVWQFLQAAGLERPTDHQVLPDGTGFRLDPEYLKKAIGNEIGVWVHLEADRKDPTKQRDRVKGYVSAAARPSRVG